MPSKLQVDLLVIRIGSRALMDPKECGDRQNWYRVASRYGSTDAHIWRSRSEQDRVRDISRLVEYARCHACSVILAGVGSTSYFESRPREGTPAYIREFLKSGIFDLRCVQNQDDDRCTGLGTEPRMAISRIAQQEGDALVKING